MPNKILIVDLDGTLIRTDLLFECLMQVVFKKPWLILYIPFWLFKGRTHLKMRLAANSSLDIKLLPYNNELIKFLVDQHKSGRKIILCTGSWHTLAKRIYEHFDFFSDYHGSEPDINLTGKNKANFLINLYGEQQFTYAGNDDKDLHVWNKSHSAIVVSGSKRLLVKAKDLCEIEMFFQDKTNSFRTLFKTARVHQWVKNVLIFTPLLTAHQAFNLNLLNISLRAFFAFCLCASATYIINDLADLESDRKHAKKSKRPLPSGDINILSALIFFAFLLLSSILICSTLPYWFNLCILAYFLITISYSFKLKSLHTIDITTLASLYTLRIIAGGAAVSIIPSFWLLSFSMFIFFSLAIVKRLSELLAKASQSGSPVKVPGRGYNQADITILQSLASSSGVLSIFVFAMYINSDSVILLYSNPKILWFICPVFGYWIVRILIMATRGEIDEDPVVFAIKDWRSWLAGVTILAISSMAKFSTI